MNKMRLIYLKEEVIRRMRKSVTVIAYNQLTLDSIFAYLSDIFRDYVLIKKYTVKAYLDLKEDHSDLVLLSGERTYRAVEHKIGDKKYLIGHRYIDYRNITTLVQIKPDATIYLVNDEASTAVEGINQLREIGYEFNMIPFYPGAKVDTNIKIAITVGEPSIVPDGIETVYDIGSRVSSISTISTIAVFLELTYSVIDTITMRYMSHFVDLLQNNWLYMTKFHQANEMMKTIMDHSKYGICLMDQSQRIISVTERFQKMLGISQRNMVGQSVQSLFKNQGYEGTVDELIEMGGILTNPFEEDILIEGHEVPSIEGSPIILYSSYVKEVNEKERLIRRNSVKSNDKRRYTFDDYITHSPQMCRMIEKAKKMALNNSCVLIQGESGTGKEILAQAIHHHSPRSHENFVAINFAAIQPTLLESELFGYTSGSFTGAKKNGSMGLIEKAHKGTIFFDEIGDAPMSFQVRLLRVLQEREIRRIGDTLNTPVDIRVIVATNRNLMSMVKEGTFREDLFYRINVMPLETVPLRNRKEDIHLLMNHYIKLHFNDNTLDMDFIITEALKRFLMTYEWKGNVRELINIVEYFLCIKGAKKVEISDLPSYMIESDHSEDRSIALSEFDIEVLKIIQKNPKIGRKKICEHLPAPIKEGKVRSILIQLRESEFIQVNTTRGGCVITNKGNHVLGSIG